MAVGAVAKAGGVGVETIRVYERSGLLAPPPRTAAGYRQYAPDAVQRVIFLKRIQRFGFTLAEASEFLTLQEGVRRVPMASDSRATRSPRWTSRSRT